MFIYIYMHIYIYIKKTYNIVTALSYYFGINVKCLKTLTWWDTYTQKKMLGYFFKPNASFSLLGHFTGLFLIFLPRCGFVLFLFFLPKCWVQLVGSFYWFIFYIFNQVLSHFNAGLFFLPNCWVDPVSDGTSQQPSCWVTDRARAF